MQWAEGRQRRVVPGRGPRTPRRVEQLAVLGGRPAFDAPLHVGRPGLGDRAALHARLDELLDRAWLTNNGPNVRAFERAVAELLEVRHCVATCNGTTALLLLVRALDMRGEVIVPSLTFAATAHAIAWSGLTPVFCDVDPATHNLDPARVGEYISERTGGIVAVHLWGRPAAVDGLQRIADHHDIPLCFDAAHAFACSHRGKMIGGFGRGEVFSFHATKVVNAFEGGAVTTNDDGLAERLRLLRNFGFVGFDDVQTIGINGKMSEMSAAMGLTSLESRAHFTATNYRNYRCYSAELAPIDGLHLLRFDEREHGNFQYLVVEIDETRFGLDRDRLVRLLHAENVLARRYFHPGCHRMPPYLGGATGTALPATERLAARLICLPTGTSVGPREIETIGALLRLASKHAARLRSRLDGRRE